ncbi:hypothetical protein V7x_28570 [Crateriforma conspicua]|uniref:Uncharacterized protein n=1 Tax=Crateriforma conspicua TaxID=2527996 RepID=A0A5C6G267_9PLAN|nr:hypothetical protein [Crateriforma conspicua]TWU67283.1 hypothetical protein V7x_28570 [Crateriforma conspicua]
MKFKTYRELKSLLDALSESQLDQDACFVTDEYQSMSGHSIAILDDDLVIHPDFPREDPSPRCEAIQHHPVDEVAKWEVAAPAGSVSIVLDY